MPVFCSDSALSLLTELSWLSYVYIILLLDMDRIIKIPYGYLEPETESYLTSK
jgi:hypothetical protein